jgi:hypothetical protein
VSPESDESFENHHRTPRVKTNAGSLWAGFFPGDCLGDLDRLRFGGRADAAIVTGGVWRLCDRERFRGECREFAPGRYDSLGSLNSRVSSVELVAATAAPVSAAPPPATGARVVFYEYPNFGGRSLVIDRREMPNFDWMGFNDRAASMRIEDGYWMLCTDARFQGECRTFGPGDYAQLPWDIDRKISSARRVPEMYGGVPRPYSYVR